MALLIDKYLAPMCVNFTPCYQVVQGGRTYVNSEQDKDTITITSHNQADSMKLYIYYPVLKGETLFNYLHNNKFTLATFLQVWWQILYAIYLAQYYYQFTHYNLKSDNIIIEELNQIED